MDRMKKVYWLFGFWLVLASIQAQSKYRTQIFDPQIKTLQTYVNGDPLSYPVLNFHGNESLRICFDQLSHAVKSYSYSIVHCNADWTPSSLSEIEYIDGFASGIIYDYQLSFNTTQDYTHYWFSVPNRDFQLKLSGNYVVKVYEGDEPDKVVCTTTFSVVNPAVNVFGKIRTNTDAGYQEKYQQIDFEVLNQNFPIRDVFADLKAVVRQNGRPDNGVSGLKPTFTMPGKQSYINNKALIFEGGNEFRQFDIASIRAYDYSVENIEYIAPYYHVELKPDGIMRNIPYQYKQDVNGKYVINLLLNDYDDDTEADYVFVHFQLYSKEPAPNGRVYLSGDFTQHILDENSELSYNASTRTYEKTLLLKQGGYTYQYLFVPNGETAGRTEPIEGSHWETNNDYQLFIYYKGFGERYDQLIGYQLLK